MTGSITDVGGIKVGHAEDAQAVTGCTVLLFDPAVRGGIYYGGHASGTRACDLFREDHLNDELHGLILSGGSNYGLDAAGGVMRYLEERGIGFSVGPNVIPLVPAAIIFDLSIGDSTIRPDSNMAYQASMNASSDPVLMGSVGAGTGATVGKIHGMARAMKGGLGSASIESPYGRIGALAVINAFGDIFDPDSGEQLAGPLDESKHLIERTEDIISGNDASVNKQIFSNTTLAVVATELKMPKSDLNQLAKLADNAIVKTHSPSHHRFDGDVLFTVSTAKNKFDYDLDQLGRYAEQALIAAIISGIKNARAMAGISCYLDLSSR